MIHLFEKSGLMFPRRWANSVAAWIGGICSPSGTIKIVNDMNPGEGPSAKFDVDVDVLFEKLRDRLDREYVSRAKIGEVVDQRSIVVSSGVLQVSSDYVRDVARLT